MIITQDLEDKSIFIGDIVVDDRKSLIELRDFLMQYNNGKLETYKVISTVDANNSSDLYSFRSLLEFGYFREGNKLVHQYLLDNFSKESSDDYCGYRRDNIYSVYLNSILLFSSLLGELDSTGYDTVVQKFVGTGIYNCHSFGEMWPICSMKLATSYLKKLDSFSYNETKILRELEKLRLMDLKAFRTALKLGIIRYEINRKITKEEYSNRSTFRGVSVREAEQIIYNNIVILGEKHHVLSPR